jgi:hypothetical protein
MNTVHASPDRIYETCACYAASNEQGNKIKIKK